MASYIKSSVSRLSDRLPLRLYNVIWATNKLPVMGKDAIIIPIPKPSRNGEMRPILLTSGLCKVFERMVLERLQYVTIHTWTRTYMASYLEVHTTACTGSKATWKQSTIFIDLKGSFDRTHSIVILAELSKIIQAKMLHLKDYLTDRQVAVYFEGVYSKWWCMELGIFCDPLQHTSKHHNWDEDPGSSHYSLCQWYCFSSQRLTTYSRVLLTSLLKLAIPLA